MPQPTILITGASGNYGQQLIAKLVDTGIAPSALLLLTRNPQKLSSLAETGIVVRKGSFDDSIDSLAAAFRGADVVFMISTSRAGARLPQHQNAIQAAKVAGASHIVYTSFVSADIQSPTALVAQEHRGTEELLRKSGLSWTSLRDSMYMEAMSDVVIPSALESGGLQSNAGSGKVAFVSRVDCVEAAAAVLKNPHAHENIAYNITGSELFTWKEVVDMAASLSRRTVEWQDTTEEESFRIFDDMGIPRHPTDDEFEKTGIQGIRWNSTDIVSLGKAVKLGELDVVSDDLERLTGRQPRTMHKVLRARLLQSILAV
jgi:NAD(P)H dehydrogenase (quinone)